MKLDLTTIRIINVDPCDTLLKAASYVQKMYDNAYGERAGRVDLLMLTPNEERLIEALKSRFGGLVNQNGGDVWSGSREPIVVYAGSYSYCFISCEPYEGIYWPSPDTYI
jgi:hypothetical protein